MYGAANSERRRRRQDSNSDGDDQQSTTPNGHKRVCIRNNTVRSRGLQRIAEEDVPTTSRDMPPAPIYPVGGRVVSVQLQNFMCHSHLKVSFDVERNNCFYIGGPNGSGKSALFAAMNIGLGGRGNHNDRGNSVRTYIKNGESKATITIVLTNEGDEAYDVNTYGNRITIERVISAASNAGSKYTIRGSKDNKVISTKKSDIDRILDRLNIQLENPVYWMSQDRSRQFLQEMKPAKLYQIFVHATELETMKNCYRRVMDYLNDFDQQLQLMAKRLPELEQKARTLKEIVKRHRNVNDERIQLNTFGWMILWIPVRDALHKRIDKEKKLEKAKDALEKLDAEVESITADKNKVEEEKAAAIAEIEELSGPTSSVAAQVTEKKQQVRVAFQRFKQAESQARDKNNEVRCRSQEMATVRKQLDKLLESGPSQTKDAAQKIQEDIERNEQEMLAASNGAEGAEEEVRRLQLSEQQFQGKLAKIRGDVDHWQREIRFREEKLRAEKRSAQSGAAKFGEKMPDLQALIASETRFVRKPVGPLGQYVKVRDEKWALAVELAIKPETLGAFACDNFKDSVLLRQLVGRCRWSGRTPAIIVSKFKDTPYNTSAHEPPTQFETVLRQIEVSDPVVYNTLIDQTKIESILLINSDQEARTLMQSNPPPNAAKGFTLSGAEVFASGRGKQYRFYANQHSSQQAQYLRAGGGRDSSRELHGEIAEFKRLLQEQRPQIDQIEKQLQVATRELRAASDQLRRANDNLPRIERDGRDLKRQLDKLLAQASSNNTEILREEFSKLQLLHDEAVKAAKDAKKAADEGETAFEEAQEEEKMAEQKLTAAKKRIEPFHAQLTKFEADLATLESQLQVNIAKRTKVDQIRQRFEEEVGALQAQHDQCYEQAINSEMPVPDGWTVPPDLDALPDTQETTDRYTQLEQRLLAAQQALGDPMEDKNKYDEAVARYRDNKLVHKQLHKIHQQLMSRLKHREEKYRLVRSSMSLRLKLSFMRLMNMRQFGGKVEVLHERKEIVITVETHSKKGMMSDENNDEIGPSQNVNMTQNPAPRGRMVRASDQGLKDLKGLSGGERSYTTACFIMALWEGMDAPFRCMDEFDVFMDMVNRRIVMELLVDLATQQFPSYQFIFFTPQGVTELGKRDRVDVYEMPRVRDAPPPVNSHNDE